MKHTEVIKGFSKLNKTEKIEWLIRNYAKNEEAARSLIESYWHNDDETQKLHDEFIENTLTNFYLPFGIAPNFLINGRLYALPMAIEESSVVAAASKAANFWLERGGFKSEIISTTKIGHVHFIWQGENPERLEQLVAKLQPEFYAETDSITHNMRSRGGGILSIALINKTDLEPGYYQLEARFETCDSMGANFINSCLESFAKTLRNAIEQEESFEPKDREVQVVMSILSNFTPECLVRCEVECAIAEINEGSGISNEEFAEKFCRAIRIADVESYRAVTHNKGIMNGIDSVVLATGNDFRAIEACAHAFAGRSGKYKSLTYARNENGRFTFGILIPMSLGTVGGITSLHPMVKFAHEMLGNPGAAELMQITAAAGLAQNFSAVRSLITSGIQKGHMKMHLLNILNQLGANDAEKTEIVEYFKDKTVSFSATVEIFTKIRSEKGSLANS